MLSTDRHAHFDVEVFGTFNVTQPRDRLAIGLQRLEVEGNRQWVYM